MFARSCVFGKQLLLPIYCDRHNELTYITAPLIANVRGHFAEFLNQRSPERLSMLYSPTCVSFSTVSISLTLRAFLGRYANDFEIMLSRLPYGLYQSPDRYSIAVPHRKLIEAKEY